MSMAVSIDPTEIKEAYEEVMRALSDAECTGTVSIGALAMALVRICDMLGGPPEEGKDVFDQFFLYAVASY